MWTNSGPTKIFPLNSDLCNNDEFSSVNKNNNFFSKQKFPTPQKVRHIPRTPGIPYSVRRSKMLLFSKVNSSSCSGSQVFFWKLLKIGGWVSKA